MLDFKPHRHHPSDMRKIAYAALAALTLAGCNSASLVTGDTRRAVALAPYARVAGLGQISVAEGAAFHPAQVNGAPAWCSAGAAYFAPMEAKAICVIDPSGQDQPEGWFKTAMVIQPAAVWRFDVDIPYRVGQTASLPPRR
jgi:hypothetical protein